MQRKIVILPENFAGPWSMGFSCPVSVYAASGERLLAVLVADQHTVIPEVGRVLELGNLDTLNGTLERAGLTRTPPPPVVVPRPALVSPAPPAVIVLPPSEDITDPPVENPPEVPAPVREPIAPPEKPRLLTRLKGFFKR